MGIIFSSETSTVNNALTKKEVKRAWKYTWLELLKHVGSANLKRTLNSTWLELLKVGSANLKRTLNSTWLELLEYGAYGLFYYYPLIMIGYYKIKYNNNSSSSRWSNLVPQDIMEQILQRLCINDFLRVRKVCRSWRSAVDRVVAEKHCAPKPQLPQLLMFKTSYPYPKPNPNPKPKPNLNQFLGIKDHTLVNFYDGCRVSHSYHAELFGKYCFGSIEGWLIITDAFLKPHRFTSKNNITNYIAKNKINVFFFNPISRAKVRLPDHPARGSIFFYQKAVASSVPDNPECLVAAISHKGDLVFCRPSYSFWITLDRDLYLGPGGGYMEIAIHNGTLYALTFADFSFVHMFNLLSNNPKARSILFIDPNPWADDAVTDSWIKTHDRLVNGASNQSSFYLVTDLYSNELLLIAQISYNSSSWPPKTKMFRVFRLDQHRPYRWLQLETLGDRILFISHTSCMCISASMMRERMGNLEEEEDLLNRGNCIFFAFDYDCTKSILIPSSKAREVGVFSLADGRIRRKCLGIRHMSSATRPPLWFTPSL